MKVEKKKEKRDTSLIEKQCINAIYAQDNSLI